MRKKCDKFQDLPGEIYTWVYNYLFYGHDVKRVPEGEQREQFRRCLLETANHVPQNIRAQSYRVLYTETLYLEGECAAAALPINLILVKMDKPNVHPNNQARVICEAFDITLCSVALQNVTDDLRIQTFRHFNGAEDMLRRQKLQLNATAFAKSVPITMRRIVKYAARGYSW